MKSPVIPVQSPACRWVAWGLLAFTLLVYLSRPLLTGVPYLGGGGDTLPTRLVPVSLLCEGNVDLDEFPELRTPSHCPYFLKPIDGHFYTVFPLGGPVLLAGVFASLQSIGLDVLHNERVRDLAVSTTAATLSALSVLLVYLTYARRGAGRALAVAAVFGFGTGVWPMCAQDLWQQTYGVFLMSLCLFGLERGWDDSRWLGWLGLPVGLLFFVRPGNALLVSVLGLTLLYRNPRQLVRFALLSVPFLGLTIWHNVHLFGSVFGGYTVEASTLKPLAYLADGFPGLLVSPARGLFVYSPVLLLASWALVGTVAPERRSLRWILAALVLVQVFLYGSYGGWYGGYCYGPRFLLEVMPACAGLLWYAWPRLTAHRCGQAALAFTVLWSLLANGVGYVYGWQQWNAHPDIDHCLKRLWDWRDSPLAAVVLGLPPSCPHPLQRAGYHDEIAGVLLEWGRGWSTEEHTTVFALGHEAELWLDFQGQPVGQLVLDLRVEPDLPQPQVVTAFLNERMKTKMTLAAGSPQYLVIPVSAADLRLPSQRLTIQFSVSRRRSILDLRPIAAEVKGFFIGLR